MGWKRDQSAVNEPCRSVTSGVHRVLFTMLNPSSAFPCEHAELRKRGLSTARFRDYLERRRSCLNTSGRPLFSRMRTKGLSLVLQCTRGRPLARSRDRPHRVFGSFRESDSTFSRVDFTNFLDHIRKGCRPIFAQFSCRSRFCRATESGVSRA